MTIGVKVTTGTISRRNREWLATVSLQTCHAPRIPPEVPTILSGMSVTMETVIDLGGVGRVGGGV